MKRCVVELVLLISIVSHVAIAQTNTPTATATLDQTETMALRFPAHRMSGRHAVFSASANWHRLELEKDSQTLANETRIRQLTETNVHQKRLIWIGTGCFLVLLLLLFRLYYQYNYVYQSRQQIQNQSDQLTLRIKELHHRAKNNLAIISSLLFLQANHLDDEDTIEAIRVSQQRVEAMSLIHNRLYQGPHVTTVNMREYLTDLIEGLVKAYGYQVSTFNLQLKVELGELDVNTAIPLGLIVNELLTNSFKHAYTMVQCPLLRIALHASQEFSSPGIILEVQDNGPGIELADWQKNDPYKSFGKHLIASLSQQLEGRFDLTNRNGTLFHLYIPYTPS